jgi:hypothetical protein
MADAPNRLTIELEEKDIKKDLASIIEAMSRIRFEAIGNRNIPDETTEQYLHLTQRLAADMRALVTPSMIDNLQFLARSMDEDDALLFYDSMQDRYWSEVAPEFIMALEKAVIQLMGDRCTSLDYKHHIAQAVKYLGARSESPERREAIVNSIAPLHGPLRGSARQLFNAEYLDRFCNREGFDFGGGFSLTIPDLSEIIANAVHAARQLGYISMKVAVREDEYHAIEGRFPGMMPRHVNFGRRKDRVLVEVPLNKAPIEPSVDDCFDVLSGFVQSPTMFSYMRSFKPKELGKLLSEFDLGVVRRHVVNNLMSKGVRVAPNALNHTQNIDTLARAARDILEEHTRYPDIYGFSVMDKVAINGLVDDGTESNEEGIWTGSEGEIISIEDAYSIEFFDVRGTSGRQKPSLKGMIWDVETQFLRLDNKSSTEFPGWYERKPFDIGDVVEVTEDYDEEYDDDIHAGSKGRVIGHTYNVEFTWINAQDGTRLQGRKEDGIHHLYLDRVNKFDQEAIAEETEELIRKGLDASQINSSGRERIHFEQVSAGKTHGYVNAQDVGQYKRHTMLINHNGSSYVVSYFCSPDNEPRPKDIVKAVSDPKKPLRDTFTEAMEKAGAVYAHLAEFRDSKKVDEFELVG